MSQRRKAVSVFFNTKTYLANSFNIELRKTLISELLQNKSAPARVLDIGCGDGSLSIPFAKKSDIILIDIADNMLNRARGKFARVTDKKKVEVIKGDVLTYPFQNKFDLVLCIGVLAHVESIDNLLNKIYELLSDHGFAIIQFSDTDHFRYKKFDTNEEAYGYRLNIIKKDELLKKMDEMGLTLLKIKGYSWSFLPLTFLPQKLQYTILNSLRKTNFFDFLNSEWLILVSKQQSQ